MVVRKAYFIIWLLFMSSGAAVVKEKYTNRLKSYFIIWLLFMSSGTAVAKEKYTNRLIDSPSPYLQQHAHNPVDWYPWGSEAIQRAKKEDKPIFLSIGYSTCYWCHVMEREVFENPKIAEVMNRLFVNIKVDREERPDIDEIYMTATQLITKHGGWPNSVFMTPDMKPFFAGTYFAPGDAEGRPGFPTILQKLNEQWVNNRAGIEESAESVESAIKATLSEGKKGELPETMRIRDVLFHLRQYYDPNFGGFYNAPKFPHETYLSFLLDFYKETKEKSAIDMAATTLDNIAAGGIYDHVGGGFHRYSTDSKWTIPHYEKMLYNQALITNNYSKILNISGGWYYRNIIEETLNFVQKEMTDEQGGFYSAFDAETDAVEGAYYVWTEKELRKHLTKDEFSLFNSVYKLAELPELPRHKHTEGKTIYAKLPLPELAEKLKTSYEDLSNNISLINKKLFLQRSKRKLPRLDTKIIASWNGLMIEAFANAGLVIGNKGYVETAEKAARFILNNMQGDDGRLNRIWKDGKAYENGYLEDYSFLIKGLLTLYKASGDEYFILAAQDITKKTEDLFHDKENGGYYFTDGSENLLIRIKKADDSAIPSGAAVLAHSFLDFYEITGEKKWLDKAKEVISASAIGINRAPVQYTHMVNALFRLSNLAGSENKYKEPILATASDFGSGNKAHVYGRILSSEKNKFNVDIKIEIEKEWHINANPASLDFLIPTTVDLRAHEAAKNIKISYPRPKKIKSPFDNKDINIYEGNIVINIKAEYKKPPKDLHAVATFQACRDNACLEPTSVVITFEGEVND